ncbi:MAG: T9SS type A sorting domain-containing protein, partial [Bacteroidota bacterium]|nr:T9SS type A sorting domain-containing protein [Bacteroidota bacterium]
YRSGIKAQNGDIYYSQKDAEDAGKIQNHNSFSMIDFIDKYYDENAFYDENSYTCSYILTKNTKYNLYSGGKNIMNYILYPLTSQVYNIDYIITVPKADCNLTIDAGQNQTIEKGATTTLTATGSSDYKFYWYNSSYSSNIYQVSPTITTTYTVTAVLGSCSATDNVIVTVNQPSCALSVNAGSDQTINKNGNAILSATSTGDNNSSYQWSNNGGNNSTVIVTPSVTTTYVVLVVNGNCTATDDVVITVNTNCSLSVIAGSDQVITKGGTATLTAIATGGTNYNYSWSNNSTSSSTIVNPTQTTTYTVIVNNGSCSASDNVVIAVNPAGCNLSVNAGNDQTIGNSPITLTATPTGGNNYTYSWSNGAGSSQQVNVNPSATTTYCVTVVSGNCSAMDNVIISVTGTTGINTTIKQIEQTFDIYPNPFNDKTSIHFNLIKSEHVTINIYDLIGNKVTTLVNEVKTAGEHIIDLNRNTINPGVYFIEYKSGENKILKKIVLL